MYIVAMSVKENNLKKILVIRFSSIGDIILCSPVFRCLKTQLGAEIHWLTKSKFAFINEHNPYIDKIIRYEDKYKDTMKSLRRENYDLIVDLHKNLRSIRFCNALRKPVIRYDKLNVEKWILVQFRKDLIKEPRHIVDRYFESLAKIGLRNDGKGLDYFIAAGTINPLPQEPYIAYGTGGTYYTKKMPPDQIIRHFSELPHPLVLLGGPTEEEAARQVKQALGDRCINMVGRCDLHTTALIIREAEWVISHDTATMHIAAAFQKNILSLWGATSPQFGMAPYLAEEVNSKSVILEKPNLSCHPCSKLGGNKCPKGHFKCMTALDEDFVREKIREVQSRRSP